MADQDAPPVEEDQHIPDAEAPETSGQADQPEELFSEHFDPATLDEALRPAYNQMRADYTQKTQTVAEQRREIEQERQLLEALRSDDPAVQAQALSALGLELEEEDEPEEEDYDDPYEQRFADYEKRLAQYEQVTAQQAQAAQEQQEAAEIDAYIDDRIEDLSKKTGVELDEDEQEALIAQAFVTPNADGLPDFDAAYERLYVKVLGKQKQRWVQSKQAPQPGSGQSGSPAVDKSNPKHTRDQMARILEAGMDDE